MPLDSLHALHSALTELEHVLTCSAEQVRADARARTERQAALDRRLDPLRRLAALPPGPPVDHAGACGEPGWVYLSSQVILDTGEHDAMAFEIAGNAGAAQLVLVSGVSQADIIAAINAFTGKTGVRAARDPVCHELVALRSELPGADRFVRVAQVEPRTPFIVRAGGCDEDPRREQSPIAIIDWGEGIAGDLDCDTDVDTDDLVALLFAWGACPDDCPADLNGDGAVDTDDLLALLRNWSR